MFTIYNLKLKTESTPLESLGALACRIYNPAIPQYRAVLCRINYARSAVEFPLTTTDGYASFRVVDFAQVDYVEIGGSIYSEAEDFTALLPGEYVYDAYTEFLTIRIY